MKKTCRYESRLSALVDNELSDDQERNLRSHLKICLKCQNKFEEICQANEIISSLPEIEPSKEFDRKFWEKISSLEAGPQRQSFWRTWIFNWRPLAAAGLTAGLAAGLYVGMFRVDKQDFDVNPEDLFMTENLELLSDYELIQHLDLLENWEVINQMKDHT